MNTGFVEQNCIIEHDGQFFEAAGAFLLPCTDGKIRGVIYVNKGAGEVRTWHGDRIAAASFVDYQGNFCRMRRVSFTLDGHKYIGDYCPDWADACKVRTTKVDTRW